MDSRSQVTIIFEKWYVQYLSKVPIHPVSGLAIWGLSEASYLYKSYLLVEVQFPKEFTGAPDILSILALICPGAITPDLTPVILGTNAILFKRLTSSCQGAQGAVLAHVLWATDMADACAPGLCGSDNVIGSQVRWTGPSPLAIQPQESCCALCHLQFCQPVSKGLLLTEASDSIPLPQGIMLQSIVSAVKGKIFSVLLQNETKKDT